MTEAIIMRVVCKRIYIMYYLHHTVVVCNQRRMDSHPLALAQTERELAHFKKDLFWGRGGYRTSRDSSVRWRLEEEEDTEVVEVV